METTTYLESETIPMRKLFRSVEADGCAPKIVKRRRREPVPAITCINGTSGGGGATTTAVKRSSRFRGVSKHRWTGRYEAHLWDKNSWNVTQRKKGKQVYLGAFNEEEAAARAYDLAAIKYWGPTTIINFPVSNYDREIGSMKSQTKEEYLASLRRRSSGFSRGVSKYRGVARHHNNGRWEARIGRVFENKYLYLGTYNTQEEAAHAYDIAAIEYKGINAVTNFDLSTYITWRLRPQDNHSLAPVPMPVPQLIDNENSIEELLFSSSSHINHQKQEALVQTQRPLMSNPHKSSSTTALGLLLRSSMFRDLVNKNSK